MTNCVSQSSDLDVISKAICSSMFFILCGYCMCNYVKVGELRMQAQETRFSACLAISMFICITSCLVGVIQITDLDDFMIEVDGVQTKKFDGAKYLEWALTCPLMQTQLVIFAGPKAVKIGSYNTAMYTCGTVLMGFIASVISNDKEIWKCVFFAMGTACFLVMARTLDQLLREATDHTACFFWGTHPLRHLFVFLVITWTPFPILWLMSPEGFQAAKGELQGEGVDANFIITFANVVAKVLFVIGMQLAKVQLRAVNTAETSTLGKYATEPGKEVTGQWLSAGAPSQELNAKQEVHALVLQVCCEHGNGKPMANTIITKLDQQFVHSVRTLALMGSDDLAGLGVPAGVRVWLEKEAKQQAGLKMVGEDDCESQLEDPSPTSFSFRRASTTDCVTRQGSKSDLPRRLSIQGVQAREDNLFHTAGEDTILDQDVAHCRWGRRPSDASTAALQAAVSADPLKMGRKTSSRSNGEASTQVSLHSQRIANSSPSGSDDNDKHEDRGRTLSPLGRCASNSPRNSEVSAPLGQYRRQLTEPCGHPEGPSLSLVQIAGGQRRQSLGLASHLV